MNNLKKPHLRLLIDPGHFLSFGFGSGFSPFAPGTIGSFLAIPIGFFMSRTTLSYRLLILGFLIVLGIYLCGRSASLFKNHDHSSIVFDEIVGMLIPLVFISFTFVNVLVCFCLFRFFDILKPWPICFFDSAFRGGFGIMIDDLVAGLLTLLIFLFCARWLDVLV